VIGTYWLAFDITTIVILRSVNSGKEASAAVDIDCGSIRLKMKRSMFQGVNRLSRPISIYRRALSGRPRKLSWDKSYESTFQEFMSKPEYQHTNIKLFVMNIAMALGME
jgi:hypothetical protein